MLYKLCINWWMENCPLCRALGCWPWAIQCIYYSFTLRSSLIVFYVHASFFRIPSPAFQTSTVLKLFPGHFIKILCTCNFDDGKLRKITTWGNLMLNSVTIKMYWVAFCNDELKLCRNAGCTVCPIELHWTLTGRRVAQVPYMYLCGVSQELVGKTCKPISQCLHFSSTYSLRW